ncbi:FAD-binding oxidoreductase [Ottowia sp. VDI28]|uniref:FAD-binding oxidoreductase n=1 Tax=Ottowia sp. VDI28 TaxID=3133968 RepID=UPI003C2D0B63
MLHPVDSASCPSIPETALASLRALLGDRFSTAPGIREHHGRDESPFPLTAPDAVALARSAEEISALMKIANAHRIPVIPYGAGSSVEGQILAVRGGISLDLSQMDRIVQVNADDMTATVQAGVRRLALNEAVRHAGLFFPVDPGADATLGGMCATRASGTNAVRYGTMRENVLALTVVLADGRVLRLGTRARKSSAGYDLTRLMLGSEGTLGVITEVTLRLHPLPTAVSAAVCAFPTVQQAVRTAIEIMQSGIPIARCELLDTNAVRAVNRHDQLQLREAPMLLMEFHGSDTAVQEQAQMVEELAEDNNGERFEWATTPETRSRLWTARHHAYLAALQTRPGCRSVTTDACVPISELACNIDHAVADAEAAGIPYFIVGHVGDGNFHMGYLIDPSLENERAVAEQLNRELVRRAIASGGTCTGEHGIGLHKMDFLIEEAGLDPVQVMASIKRVMDPNNVLNPGKIFALALD